MGSLLRDRLLPAGLLVAVLGLLPPSGAAGASCPPGSPVLTGPAFVQAGETYAISWTNVLGDKAVSTSTSDAYVVLRATDPGFASILDSTTTQRSALTLSASGSASALYHRVTVRTSCPLASPAAILSNVLTVSVKTTCDAPPSVGEPCLSPHTAS